jgi:hypothetical protein
MADEHPELPPRSEEAARALDREIVALYRSVMAWVGTIEDNEAWPARLEEIHPDYWGDDHMETARQSVERRRAYQRLVAEVGARLSREQMIAFIEQLLRAEGTVVEQGAIISLLEDNLSDPMWSDIIYWPPKGLEGLSAEQIVDRALGATPSISANRTCG